VIPYTGCIIEYVCKSEKESVTMQRVLIGLLIMVLLLSGCGTNVGPSDPAAGTAGETPAATEAGDEAAAPAQDGPVTITFGIVEFQRQTYEPIVQAFNEENADITVQIVSLDKVFGFGSDEQADFEHIMGQVVRAADTAMPLVPVRPEDLDQGYLQDLQPLMDADATFDHDDFYSSALAEEADGGVYLLPHTLPVAVLSYNKDMWTASGLAAPDPDWTYEEMIGAAEQIAQKQGDTVEVYGLADGSSGIIPLIFEMQQAGVDVFSTPLETLRLDTPEVETALEQVAAQGESGAVYIPSAESGVVTFGSQDVDKLIRNQQVGMWLPNLLDRQGNDEQPAFAIGTVPFPSGPTPNFFFGSPQGYVMSSGTQYPQQAWRWLSFLSKQELDQPFFQQEGVITRIPARKSLAERMGYWSELDEETAAVIRETLERRSDTMPPGFTSNFGTVVQALMNALGTVASGGKDTTTALQEAQEKVTDQLAKMELTPEPTPDDSPIVVATPEPLTTPQAGAEEVTFAALPWPNADDIRRKAKEFNQEYDDIVVSITNIQMQPEIPEFADVAQQSDCFYWFGKPDTDHLDAVRDIRPLLDADAAFAVEDYPPAFLQSLQEGTALYGLPYAVDLRTLAYHKEAFEAAGLAEPTIDWTVEDLLNAVQQLDSGEGSERQYGFVSMNHLQDILFFMDRMGASYMQGSEAEPQPNFTDPAVIEAVQFYIDMLQEYSPHEALSGYMRDAGFHSEPFQLAQNGRVGLWLSIGGFFSFGVGDNTDFTVGVAPPPLGGDGVSPSYVNVRGFYIAANTEHADTCWTWMKYLSEDATLAQNSFPARLSVARSPEVVEKMEPGQAEAYESYITALERPAPENPNTLPDQEKFDPFWFFRAVDRALQGGNLEQELADAQQLTEQFLACVQAGEEASACAPQVDPNYQGYNTPEEDAE
jgi:ABC-type glycerol-3-phosphate transport system substrate-binding protein